MTRRQLGQFQKQGFQRHRRHGRLALARELADIMLTGR